MKHLQISRLVLWLALIAIAVAAIYRFKFASDSAVAHTLVKSEVRGEVLGTGTLEARVKTTISPRIQERLREVLVDQGDFVSAGQLLARLDDAETRQQVAIAETTLAAAQATVERVRADETRAQAVLQQTQLDHRRSVELLTNRIAAQADFDKTAEALHVAQADLERAQSAIREAQTQVLTAEKSLLYHKEHLAFTQIECPYDGLIVRRDRDPGGIVVPGASILQLIATNEIWVSAWVDETAMAGLKVGQPARVVFRSEPSKGYPGEVARLGRETDRETREFVVDVRLKELPANWTIGQRAEAFLETGLKSDVLAVPPAFIHWREGKAGVFINDAGRACWREVSLGLRGPQLVEVTQGLAAGQQVLRLADELTRPLTDGRRIQAK